MFVGPLWEESVNVQTCLGINTQSNPKMIVLCTHAADSAPSTSGMTRLRLVENGETSLCLVQPTSSSIGSAVPFGASPPLPWIWVGSGWTQWWQRANE